MNEFKFHINRQFGTEQFSVSATLGKDTMTQEEIANVLNVMNVAIKTQFLNVIDRENDEKLLVAQSLAKRAEIQKEVDELVKPYLPPEEPVEADAVTSDAPVEAPVVESQPVATDAPTEQTNG